MNNKSRVTSDKMRCRNFSIVNYQLSIIFALFLTIFQAEAQRCLPGQRSLEVTAGTVNGFNLNLQSSDFAFHSGIALSQYTKSANEWKFGFDYLEKRYPYKDISIPQAQFTVNAGYFLNVLSDAHKTFFVSVGVSAIGGYETVNWDNKLLFDGATINNSDNFLYGGALTLEPEAYLTDRLVLAVNVSERFLAGSSVGKLNTLFGIGIKYIIN